MLTKHHRLLTFSRVAVLASLLVLPGFVLLAATSSEASKVDFAREVMPVLSNKCFVCHGPDTHKKGELRLDSYTEATRDLGGYQAINPSSPNESEILSRLFDEEDPMPPSDAEKQLTDEEREIIAQWVREGGGMPITGPSFHQSSSSHRVSLLRMKMRS